MVEHARRKGTDATLLVMLGALVLFGLVMLASASGPIAFQRFNDSWWYARHQLVYGIIPGLFAFAALSRIDYRLWRRWAFASFIVALVLLTLVFLPGFRAEWGTSRSWLQFAGYSFQPLEAVKLLFVVFLADRFSRDMADGQRGVARSLTPFLAALGVIGLLLIAQPDFGGLMLVAGISFLIYFAAGAPWKHILALGLAGLAGAFAIMKAAPYRAHRFMTFLHPEADPLGVGYHINQAYLAIGSGGWLGLGLGHSRQKFQYLPEVTGDSVFAVMSEELGFVVTLLFLAFMGAFISRCLRIAREAPDDFGRLVAVGIASWLMMQSLLNVGSMVGLLPLTGQPLPLVSYGGSSTVMLLAALGILTNISSQSAAAAPARSRLGT